MCIDANNFANISWDVIKKKRLTDAELQDIKYEFKTIIKLKEKVLTEQPESESEGEEIFDSEGEPVMFTIKTKIILTKTGFKLTYCDLGNTIHF